MTKTVGQLWVPGPKFESLKKHLHQDVDVYIDASRMKDMPELSETGRRFASAYKRLYEVAKDLAGYDWD